MLDEGDEGTWNEGSWDEGTTEEEHRMGRFLTRGHGLKSCGVKGVG